MRQTELMTWAVMITTFVQPFLLGAAPPVSPAAASVETAAAPPEPEGQRLYREARVHMVQAAKAEAAKDWRLMLEQVQKALALRPDQPTFRYHYAAALAEAGQAEEALQQLELLVQMGMFYPVAQDPHFQSLKSLPRFAAIEAGFGANQRPIGAAQTATTLADTERSKGLIAEGLAWDPVDRVYYLGSVRKGSLLRVQPDGTVSDFSRPEDGLWGVFGLKIDAKRRHLWAATSALPELEGCKPEDKGRAGLVQYDLASGKLLRKVLLPADGAEHVLGDLELAGDGTVYATESVSPALYRLDPQSQSLERLIDKGPFISPQGLALAPDGRTLYVADYARGLFRVDIKTRTATLVTHAPSVTLLGLDGLYVPPDSQKTPMLIGIQNGVNPPRVIQILLNAAGNAGGTEVTGVTTLLANHPSMKGPTLGTMVLGKLHFIANGGWENAGAEVPVILSVSP